MRPHLKAFWARNAGQEELGGTLPREPALVSYGPVPSPGTLLSPPPAPRQGKCLIRDPGGAQYTRSRCGRVCSLQTEGNPGQAATWARLDLGRRPLQRLSHRAGAAGLHSQTARAAEPQGLLCETAGGGLPGAAGEGAGGAGVGWAQGQLCKAKSVLAKAGGHGRTHTNAPDGTRNNG